MRKRDIILPSFRHELSGIGDVTVQKEELLTILRTNKEQHRTVFEQALVVFRKKAIAALDSRIEQLRKGEVPNLYFNLPIPEEHTDDYDRAIRMLEMHVEPTVTLSEESCMRLVDDDWGWRDAFANNTRAYLAQ